MGFFSIVHERKSLVYSLATNDRLPFLTELIGRMDVDDVFVHVQIGAIGILRVIQKILRSRLPVRVIVMVDNAHLPTLKLLRAMNVKTIFSKHDSLENICKILHGPVFNNYISTELYAVIETIQPASAWAKERTAFDGVQYLTPAETEIILDLLQGISPWQVARKRFISVKTVSSHKLAALKKMEIRGLNEFFITPRIK